MRFPGLIAVPCLMLPGALALAHSAAKKGALGVCRTAVAIAFLLGAALLPLSAAAGAEKRVALVIGNDHYANLPTHEQLRTAVNDARAVGGALQQIGFEVIAGENLGRGALVDRFAELTQRLGPGDTAFFFFAGHGIALDGVNYILPSDVPDLRPGQEWRLKLAALRETLIISDLALRGVRVAVVVLDASRSNPFSRPGSRGPGGEKGLAPPPEVKGVFSLYAAGSGQDGRDQLNDRDPHPNSVFTRVLAPALTRSGTDLATLAAGVREEVARIAQRAGYEQRPAYYDGVGGERVYLAPPGKGGAGGGTGPAAERAPSPPAAIVTPSPVLADSSIDAAGTCPPDAELARLNPEIDGTVASQKRRTGSPVRAGVPLYRNPILSLQVEKAPSGVGDSLIVMAGARLGSAGPALVMRIRDNVCGWMDVRDLEKPAAPEQANRAVATPFALPTRGRWLLGLYGPQSIGTGLEDASEKDISDAKDEIFRSLVRLLMRALAVDFRDAAGYDLALMSGADASLAGFDETTILSGGHRQPQTGDIRLDGEGSRRLDDFLAGPHSSGSAAEFQQIGEKIRRYSELYDAMSGDQHPVAVYVGAAPRLRNLCSSWMDMTRAVAVLPGWPRVFGIVFANTHAGRINDELERTGRGAPLALGPHMQGLTCAGGNGSMLLVAPFPDLVSHDRAKIPGPVFDAVQRWMGAH